MPKEILNEPIDVIEHKINRISPVLLKILLKDNSTKENLRWATSTYEKFGHLYAPERQMLPEQMIGSNIDLLTPRVSKTAEEQQHRTKEKGEVFTPAWCCNMMNNFLDEDWFGRKNVFNTEVDGGWKTNRRKVTFSKKLGKTWQEYVADIRMEITCGEAPYLVSRYDVVKGEIIPVKDRIGILDRKLRIINDNVDDEETWLEQAEIAYKSTYGYDYQGDNVLIARENLLYTLVDNLDYKFQHQPDLNTLKRFATVISWNIWQMDGFDYTVPFSEKEVESDQIALFSFGDEEKKIEKTPVRIKNWNNNKTIEFRELTKGEFKMKFTYCIGNPPYQKEMDSTSDKPIYNIFMDEAYKIANKVELIHPARFLFNAGKTPKEWNEKMLNDHHLKVLYYEQDSSKVFANTDIKGGVAVTYRNVEKNYGAIEVFSHFDQLRSIREKVALRNDFKSLSDIVFAPESYKFTEKLHHDYPNIRYHEVNGENKGKLSKGHDYDVVTNIFSKLPFIFVEEKQTSKEYAEFIGLIDNKRYKRFVKKEYIKEHPNFEKYKIILPKSNGTGALGEPLSTPLIEGPSAGHTQSFISIGAFETKDEAEAAIKYIKTKFARTMLGILKITQDNKRNTWKYVPLQDFTSSSDIDWSKSIPEIDQQLYKKYNLSQEEIDFIESHVKEME